MRQSPAHQLLLCLGMLLCAPPPTIAATAVQVGAARIVVDDVSARNAEASRHLAVSDAVRFQELISTARDSAAVIALSDGTELAMGENAEVRLDEFVLGDGPEAKLSLRVGLGALRFVTGAMPKPAYRIDTPSASLTVRGTTFDLAVGADGSAYLEVESGAVRVATAGGQDIDVIAGQSLGIDAAGRAGLPRPAATRPAGLAGMIADMDLTLAEHVADLDAADLADLAVLGPSRNLVRDLGLGGLGDRPERDIGKDRPGKGKDGRGDKSAPAKK